MNDCPHAHPRDSRFYLHARRGLLLLLTCVLLAACWGDEQPAPADPAAAAPVSALPTNATERGAAPADATDASTAATPANTAAAAAAGIATLVATPAVAEGEVISPTAPAASPTPTFVPLEAEESTNCEIESSLDLVGYPNLEQRMGCALEPAIFEDIAINEFGPADQPINRFMLWFSHEDNIYVLLPDGTYEVYEDTWEEATDPTYPCNPTDEEADSPPLPRRGFGKLWCNNPDLQEILGMVPREERLCQYSVLQRFERGQLLACFEDATIRYFRILDSGQWDLQVQ